ncbi:hypothetical protein CCH79_00002555, partial [Gambusia affinis]
MNKAAVFRFHSFFEYFLTPKRQHPQQGCHLSSIIPPLPDDWEGLIYQRHAVAPKPAKTKALEDNKKKTSLLKDNSWIRKNDDEDEPVDQDPNFAKSVLSRVNNTDTTDSSSEPKPTRTTKTSSTSSVQALSKSKKTTVSSSETVTVKSSNTVDDTKTPKVTVKSSSTPKDDLYDTFLPKTITSPVRDKTPSTPSSTRSVSYGSYSDDTPYSPTSSYNYEYSSLNSPSLYSSTSYSSTKSGYQSPDRPVLEKDLCTTCRKPFTGDAKMVLDDMKIKCHATCFKCDVCNSSLGYMKAGDSMWIYKRKVHCENCFESTR